MQLLGHPSTSFSSRNFSSSERRTASTSSDTITGGRRLGGWLQVRGQFEKRRQTTQATSGLRVGKVLGFLYCGPRLASSRPDPPVLSLS